MTERDRERDRRKKRTSLNQYLMYLHALEEDEIFRTGNIPKDVEFDYISKKWEKLTEELNTCDNGPSMLPDEWKKRLNDWKNSTRCKFRRSQNGEKGISITALEKKALALFGTAPYTTTAQKPETKPQNTSTTTTESEHNAEVESMLLQEVQFNDVDENQLIIRKRSISTENHASKNIKIEKKQLPINRKTIIYDFEASDENIDDDATQFIVDDIEVQKASRNIEENETIRNEQSLNLSPKKISLTQNIHNAATSSDSAFHSTIAYQLKRIADVKEEKLKFEIAKYKFNNPGFKYDYSGSEATQEEPQAEHLLVFNEPQYN